MAGMKYMCRHYDVFMCVCMCIYIYIYCICTHIWQDTIVKIEIKNVQMSLRGCLTFYCSYIYNSNCFFHSYLGCK